MAAEQQAIHDSLVDQAQRAKLASAQAREKADAARSSMLRAKAYRAFREAGGNRANFERMWETALAQANGTER
jgi:hypothetical protein